MQGAHCGDRKVEPYTREGMNDLISSLGARVSEKCSVFPERLIFSSAVKMPAVSWQKVNWG